MSKRICEVCGCEVKYTGYVVEAGLEYYCSTECLHKVYSPKEWRKMYTDGGDNYYTQWDDDDEEENVKSEMIGISLYQYYKNKEKKEKENEKKHKRVRV